MSKRPELAAKVAQCISQWSEVEIHLGAFLGLLLHANQKAAVAMYAGLENRSAQIRLITLAAEASLPLEHFDVISALIQKVIRPAMRERDRLAHWTWGYSQDVPDALLISEPARTLMSLMRALKEQPGIDYAAVPSAFDQIFVIRESDLDGILKRSTEAKYYVRLAMATVWEANRQQERDLHLRELSNVPRIREGLDRLARDRQKTQASL